MVEVFAVLSNVSSPQRLVDTARVVFSIRNPVVKGFVAVKVTGMAAQTGIPEVTKMAYKLGKAFIVLPTLSDFVELLRPSRNLLIVSEDKSSMSLNDVSLSGNERIAIIVSGTENGFTKSELGLGDPIAIPGFTQQLPPTASMALALHILVNKISKT